MQILDNMENGQIDKSESLPRTSAEDVAFDMDEIIIEEDDSSAKRSAGYMALYVIFPFLYCDNILVHMHLNTS